MLGLTQILVSTCHLLAVDVALAGPFVCLWLEWRATRRGDAAAGRIGRRLAGDSVLLLVVGSILGGATLGLMWLRHGEAYATSLARIAAGRYWYAGLEWVFSFICLGAYYALWDRLARRRWLHRALAVVGGTNLAYHFPVLFAIVAVVSTQTPGEGAIDFRRMLVAPEVVAHVAHDLLAAVVATGLYVAWLSLRASGASDEAESSAADRARLGARGAQMALLAALSQFPVGIWLWTTLSQGQQSALLFGHLPATAALGIGVLAAIALLHHLAGVSLGDVGRPAIVRCVALVVVVVLAMVSARLAVRIDRPRRDSRPVGSARGMHLPETCPTLAPVVS